MLENDLLIDLLMDAAGLAGADQNDLAAADAQWLLLTAPQRRDVLALFARQNWRNSQKGRELTRYLLSL